MGERPEILEVLAWVAFFMGRVAGGLFLSMEPSWQSLVAGPLRFFSFKSLKLHASAFSSSGELNQSNLSCRRSYPIFIFSPLFIFGKATPDSGNLPYPIGRCANTLFRPLLIGPRSPRIL